MKKICFLTGDMSRSGGTERVLSIIANELAKYENKYEIHILNICNYSGDTFFPLNSNIKIENILQIENVNFKKKFLTIVIKIRNYLKKNNINTLVDVDVISDIFSLPAKLGLNIKLISWEHFNCYNNNGTKLRDFSRRLASKYSDYIVVLTEKDKRNYKNLFNRNSNILSIYNPIETLNDKKSDSKSKQIISVGMLRYVKGFDILCDIAYEVLNKNKDWNWIVLGEGEDRVEIEKKIKKYNLNGKLTLEGNVKNIDEYYLNSSIYVMTSRNEGLPMTLLEAKKFGLPIVSFDCETGPSEIINNEVNGYLIPNGDIKEMSKKINFLIENTNKRIKMSKSTNLNIDKFDLKNIIQQWEKII